MFELLLGLVVGLGAILFVMVRGDVVGILFEVNAFVIVFGGTFGAIIITYPLRTLKNGMRAVFSVLFSRWKYKPKKVIAAMVSLSEKAQREGVFSLNGELPRLDPFIRHGLTMILDDLDEALIREELRKELVFTRKRHEQIANIFRTMGTYSPIFGLLGTLLGVVQVLKNISDVKGLGSSMAMAVATTFYGIFGSNFIFLPLAGKLEARSEEELLIKEVIIEGIISIKHGDIPLLTERKLSSFFSLKQRKEQHEAI